MNDYTGIDPTGLARLDRMGGPLFVRKMIDLFLEEAPGRLAAARTAEEAGNRRDLSDAVHSLKSSARNFGATHLSDLAERIELRALANAPEDWRSLLNELEAAYDSVKGWLEHERDILKT